MSDEKEIQIGNKTIGENTKLTLTVKTAIWIIGGFIALLSFLFTMFYFNMKSSNKALEGKWQKENKELKKEITGELKSFKSDIIVIVNPMNQNILELVKEQGEIKGDIKLIIEKQLGIRSISNSSNEVLSNSPAGPSLNN